VLYEIIVIWGPAQNNLKTIQDLQEILGMTQWRSQGGLRELKPPIDCVDLRMLSRLYKKKNCKSSCPDTINNSWLYNWASGLLS